MQQATEPIHNPRTGQRMRFLQTAADTDGGLLRIESINPPTGVAEPEHIHPKQDSRAEVEAAAREDAAGRVQLDLDVPQAHRHTERLGPSGRGLEAPWRSGTVRWSGRGQRSSGPSPARRSRQREQVPRTRRDSRRPQARSRTACARPGRVPRGSAARQPRTSPELLPTSVQAGCSHSDRHPRSRRP